MTVECLVFIDVLPVLCSRISNSPVAVRLTVILAPIASSVNPKPRDTKPMSKVSTGAKLPGHID
jgi:hypothetical protein